MRFLEEFKKARDEKRTQKANDRIDKLAKKIDEKKILEQKSQLAIRGVDIKTLVDLNSINAQLISTAQEDSSILHNISLLPEQYNNLELMMSLYECGNSYFNTTYSPQTTDVDYLMRYLQILINPNYPEKSKKNHSLSSILGYIHPSNYSRPEFAKALIEKFSNSDPLYALYMNIMYYHYLPRTACQVEFDELIANLDTDTLAISAKNYGKATMKYIPNTREDYIELVGTAIECDDFNSLALLTPQQLIDHKDYIIKAFETAKNNETLSYQKTKHFFNSVLNPIQHNPNTDRYTEALYFSRPHLLASHNIANDDNLWKSIDISDNMKESIRKSINRSLEIYQLPESPQNNVEEDIFYRDI